MARRCEGRRGNSRLKERVDLFIASPRVTEQMATEKLKVTPQAVEAMLKELAPSLPRANGLGECAIGPGGRVGIALPPLWW
jgi:hypothetical protein